MHRYKHFTEEAVYRMGQIKSRPQGERQTGLKKTDCRYVKKRRRRKMQSGCQCCSYYGVEKWYREEKKMSDIISRYIVWVQGKGTMTKDRIRLYAKKINICNL